MLLMVAATLALCGMAWLALSNPVHWGQVMHRAPPAGMLHSKGLRGLGGVALLLSLAACLLADRPSMAVLVWVMLQTFAAGVVSLLLTWRAGLLRGFVPGAWVPLLRAVLCREARQR